MPVDLAAVKSRQQVMWGSGRYDRVAWITSPLADVLCEAVEVRPGSDVLDVASGTGHVALAAARRFAHVTSSDYVPALLERGRARAAAEDLDIIFQEADAEALPFGDDSFDFVLSVIGAMFAPDQEAVARELSRVCRPGGTIGLLNWTATGFLADLFRLIAARVPPPEGVRPPASWGSEERVRELLTPYTDEIVCTPGRLPHHFASGRAYADFMITNYGPTLKAAESLSAQDASAFAEDITRLAEQHNRATDGSLTFDSDYLVVQARVRS